MLDATSPTPTPARSAGAGPVTSARGSPTTALDAGTLAQLQADGYGQVVLPAE